MIDKITSLRTEALADIQAAVNHAAATCQGKVGVVGYCWGGLLTWRAACLLSGLSAAVPYYGGGVTSPEEVPRAPKVPVLSQTRSLAPRHWRFVYLSDLGSARASARNVFLFALLLQALLLMLVLLVKASKKFKAEAEK